MRKSSQGFTLLEMLLVMILISMVILIFVNYMQRRTVALQIEKTSAQMQVILNAGLAYYRVNEEWPATFATLQSDRFLPAGKIVNPWGQVYQVNAKKNIGVFTVTTVIPNASVGVAIAGRIPMGTSTATTVTGLVLMPAEDINSARAVNFASVYRNGACVPAPTCPLKMKPQIYVLPVSAYGIEISSSNPVCTPDASDAKNCSFPVTALYSVTVRAVGEANGDPVDLGSTATVEPCYSPIFSAGGPVDKCYEDMVVGSSGTPDYKNPITKGKYWRVCLDLVTRKGNIIQDWGGASGINSALFGPAMGSILAFTKCVPENENVGSSFKVWNN